MNPKSASSLVLFSAILLLLSLVAMNPALRFGLSGLAGIIAAIPAIFGRKRTRIVGAILLMASVVIAVSSYPASKQHMHQYKKRIKEQARPTNRSSEPIRLGLTASPRAGELNR